MISIYMNFFFKEMLVPANVSGKDNVYWTNWGGDKKISRLISAFILNCNILDYA